MYFLKVCLFTSDLAADYYSSLWGKYKDRIRETL
jgi:hypothetical protein